MKILLLMATFLLMLHNTADAYPFTKYKVRKIQKRCEKLAQKNARTVIFFGDSHTEGTLGANYVKLAEKELSQYSIEAVNAGINSSMAFNLLERAADVIACNPEIVTILIGSNDILATTSLKKEKHYQKIMGLKEIPTIDYFGDSLESVIKKIVNESDARVVLISIPPVGENLASQLNQKVQNYNKVVKNLSEKYGLTYIPFYEEIARELEGKVISNRCDRMPNLYVSSFLLRLIRMKWDNISKLRKFHITADCIHFNETAAHLLHGLLEENLQ